MEAFLNFLLSAVGFVVVSYLCIVYSNYRMDKQRRKEEQEEELYRLRRDAERNEANRKDQEEKKRLELEKKEKTLFMRSTRFNYITRQYSQVAYFKKDYYPDYEEELQNPFLYSVVATTKIYFDFLRTALQADFLHNVDVHAAALLFSVAKDMSRLYDGELEIVSESVSYSLKKMFVCCGFHKNLDATNLREESKLMNEFLRFYTYYVKYSELSPHHHWKVDSDDSLAELESETISDYCDYFCDIITSPELAFSSTPKDTYMENTNFFLSKDDAQYFVSEIVPYVYAIVNDYHKKLLDLAFENTFSEESKASYEASDNDDVLFCLEYNRSHFYLEEYYYPFDK